MGVQAWKICFMALEIGRLVLVSCMKILIITSALCEQFVYYKVFNQFWMTPCANKKGNELSLRKPANLFLDELFLLSRRKKRQSLVM